MQSATHPKPSSPIVVLPPEQVPLNLETWLDQNLWDVLEANDTLTFEACRHALPGATQRLADMFSVANIRPMELDPFFRQLGNVRFGDAGDAVRAGAVDISPVLRAVLFPRVLPRHDWPHWLRAEAEEYQDLVDEKAPAWSFVKQAYRSYLEGWRA